MTTQDYADAYEDDSENVRGWAAQDAQEPPPEGLSEGGLIAWRTGFSEGYYGFDDLCMQLMQELSAQTAKCERLATGSEYLRNEIVNLIAARDEALAEIAHSSRIKVKPQPKVVKAWR